MPDQVDYRWIADDPDALMMLDQAGKVLEWNDGAERMFGYSRTEAIGTRIHELVTVPGNDAEQDHFIAETSERGRGTFEALRRRNDGTLMYVVISGKIGQGAPGELYLLFSEKDVTQLKVQRDSKSLESKFRELLDSMPDGILIVNPTGHILIANRQAERLFGYDPDELRARPIEDLLPQRFRNAHKGHRSHYFSAPRTRAMGAGLELYGLRKDGTEFPVEISLSPLKTGKRRSS